MDKGNAHLTLKCDERTPCVRLRDHHLTLCWYRTHDGRVRIDGSFRAKPVALDMLRRSHPEYQRGNTLQGRRTGKQHAPAGRRMANQTEQASRAQWHRARSGNCNATTTAWSYPRVRCAMAQGKWASMTILMTPSESKTCRKQMPCPGFVLNTGNIVMLSADSRASVSLGTGTITAAEQVEVMLQGTYSAK